jgi:uncharacterized Rmd1/YagE family protein
MYTSSLKGNGTNDRLIDDSRTRLLKSYGSNSKHQFYNPLEIDYRKEKDDINLRPAYSIDEFGDILTDKTFANKVTRTGRQRKKLAARTKGGEFEAKRKKRRVNFCCICSELDLEGLHDAILESYGKKWEAKMYEDVLHIFQHQNPPPPQVDTAVPSLIKSYSLDETVDFSMWKEPSLDLMDVGNTSLLLPSQSTSVLWATGSKEVFIFEFGAVVFWGFRKGEEDDLIILIRKYIEQGEISNEEFNEERDDMAFVTSSDTDVITIANDVITLPDDSKAKSRLSVSFAIAQSAVLGIFEARVEAKIKEFKYIPETLAANQDLRLTPQRLGTMIGEVYRIRHDVNLHSEILDTPDFFWKEEEAEVVYRMTCG